MGGLAGPVELEPVAVVAVELAGSVELEPVVVEVVAAELVEAVVVVESVGPAAVGPAGLAVELAAGPEGGPAALVVSSLNIQI